MKIKEQTRKLAAGCSKHGFEVVDETDGSFEVVDRTDEGIRLTKSAQKLGFEVVDETDEVIISTARRH
ncbi:hypothetical protein [Streptococcus pneumoniae]|uniref:hypothetical protein n=1 Tax=Streptococcus pneumoniae TaxID=1313 RepID=UPI0002CCC8B0|nr:hypothetical protein [Streptococcus pneumoniae]EMY90359.1 hypothetical protein PNI0197_01118 [Streptococcus pneumoniae PNI0197]